MSKKEIEKINTNEVSINSREKILQLQNFLVSNADEVNIVTHQDSKPFPLKHTFADGIYVRQMSMNAGSVVVGAIHKHLHVWFLLTGHISVITEDSSEDYIAPCYIVATPGTKRVIQANEDSIFVNIHKNPSNTRNIKQLEKDIVAQDFKEYEEYINQNK
jgi:quercetin dioxygenase-like cupin family protein|tara:strand:+ start:9605 stop:10084 length:480 start_codon:yes stop_codon:yes gene_type:complete